MLGPGQANVLEAGAAPLTNEEKGVKKQCPPIVNSRITILIVDVGEGSRPVDPGFSQ